MQAYPEITAARPDEEADFVIFFAVMGVNFLLVTALDRASRPGVRRLLLWTSVAVSLSTLALFKYRQFFGENLTYALGLVGIYCPPPSGASRPWIAEWLNTH